MSEEFLTLLKTLRIPFLAEPDIAKLKVLQKEWKHWESRGQQHLPLRIAEEQRAAYAAFLDTPHAQTAFWRALTPWQRTVLSRGKTAEAKS